VPARREARERALGLAYEAEQRSMSVRALIDELPADADPYAADIAAGADDRRAEIDELLGRFSQHWAVERMPAVDRALLRIGTYELGWRPDTPTGVILSEAVELAQQYSTKDSGRFVNGLLSRIAQELRTE
jgi:N utilization substance protein B